MQIKKNYGRFWAFYSDLSESRIQKVSYVALSVIYEEEDNHDGLVEKQWGGIYPLDNPQVWETKVYVFRQNLWTY